MQSFLVGIKSDTEGEFVDVYLDNVTVFSKIFDDHLQRVVFKGANLKLNPPKCRFCCSEVNYLGLIVTPIGFKSILRNV